MPWQSFRIPQVGHPCSQAHEGASRRALQISLQDGCSLTGGNLYQEHLLTTMPPEHCFPSSCTYILDPVHILSEHRHQVPLPIDDGHRHRQRDRSPRLASGHFQGRHIVGQNTRGEESCPGSIEHSRDPVGSLPTVQPSLEVASPHREPQYLLFLEEIDALHTWRCNSLGLAPHLRTEFVVWGKLITKATEFTPSYA
jgi:hypothetical protein